MPQQTTNSVENNFSGGLKTEFTALNFPENACTDTDNCVFSIVGDVTRRSGIDLEDNHNTYDTSVESKAISTYKWTNVAGSGELQIYVVQIGAALHFYATSNATPDFPMSTKKLVSVINLSTFATGPNIEAFECQFTDGNGYLFVFHPYLEPFYCSFAFGAVTATKITIQIRDFNGIPEAGVPVNYRPDTLSAQHQYNLTNQGWTTSPGWTSASSSTVTIGTGTQVFTIASGLTIPNGTNVQVYSNAFVGLGGAPANGLYMVGSVTSYAGTTLTLNVYYAHPSFVGSSASQWTLTPTNIGYISTWFSAIGNYPSNADVWWIFKNSSGVFDPATTVANITLNTGYAAKGHFIVNAFYQDRTSISGIAGLTPISTQVRPKTGTWFQGRVWYAGVDASQPATGDAPYHTWTEDIYFSQIVVDSTQFGLCYQNNDPTSEDFFDLLPTDGGVIKIQGAGSIHKLFPIQNGLLVHADNGIWFITGSQGIGFSANDYTITKISSVQCISGTSFVNVLGLPVFWNAEGIYAVSPAKQGGGLVVENLCFGTILSYYAGIPLVSKRYARGDYDPISFVIRWVFKDLPETSISDRYTFNKMLNYNTSNKAFYPFTTDTVPKIHDVKYISYPGGSNIPEPAFKYFTSLGVNGITFSEDLDVTNWRDFMSFGGIGYAYDSYFVTGYKLHGQALRKFQPSYVYVFSDAEQPTSYKIQAIWDFANSPNSGKYSGIQLITNALTRFGVLFRKHKIRGRGISLQFKVLSVAGMPFHIIGWSMQETQNASM